VEDSFRLGAFDAASGRPADVDLEELAAAVAAGDERAFELLYQRSVSDLYAYVRAHCRGEAEAEDIVANVYLNVWRSAKKYRLGSGQFRRWLFAIARNEVRDYWRARRGAPSELPLELASQTARSTRGDPVLRHTVERALEVLTPEQRDVVVLRFYGGKSHHEIAELLGKREGAVRALLLRALRRMRKVVEDASS